MTSVVIDSGDGYLDRMRNLFLTKIDLTAPRQWRAYYKNSLTDLGCEVVIEGNRYWLTIDVSARLGGFVRFKEINPAWLVSKLAQRRYAERAERLLPDAIFRAKEMLIYEHNLTLPIEERKKLSVNCDLVEYSDNQYRAHAYDHDYNDIHVTALSSYDGAKRLLREWAVANNFFYGGGHTRHRGTDEFARFRAGMRAAFAANERGEPMSWKTIAMPEDA